MSEPICVPLCSQCGERPVEPPRRLCWPCFKGPSQLATVASSTPTPTVIVNPVRELPPEPPGGWTFLAGYDEPLPENACRGCDERQARRSGYCYPCYRKFFRRSQSVEHPLDKIVREVEKSLVRLAREPVAGVAG